MRSDERNQSILLLEGKNWLRLESIEMIQFLLLVSSCNINTAFILPAVSVKSPRGIFAGYSYLRSFPTS